MKNSKSIFLLTVLFINSIAAFCQDPGGSPDGPPPAVPFEDYMHFVLIALGAIFAFYTIKRLQRKKI